MAYLLSKVVPIGVPPVGSAGPSRQSTIFRLGPQKAPACARYDLRADGIRSEASRADPHGVFTMCYDVEVYAELLALSHEATALLVRHFNGQKCVNPRQEAQNRLGELAGCKLYYETIIRMTNAERAAMLVVVRAIVTNLKAGKF